MCQAREGGDDGGGDGEGRGGGEALARQGLGDSNRDKGEGGERKAIPSEDQGIAARREGGQDLRGRLAQDVGIVERRAKIGVGQVEGDGEGNKGGGGAIEVQAGLGEGQGNVMVLRGLRVSLIGDMEGSLCVCKQNVTYR
ncbi:MAG: hypothetical protein ABIV25_02090 [Paracoccaceae bacterium]